MKGGSKKKIVKEIKVDLDKCIGCRGCEGTAQHQMEMKNAVAKLGLPAMTFEGNMADEREFEEARPARMTDLFATETLGLKKVA